MNGSPGAGLSSSSWEALPGLPTALLTEDIDVCCRLGSENLLRIQASIVDLHPVHRLTPQRLPLAMNAGELADVRNLYLDTDYGPLDCLGSVAGLGDYEQVRARSIGVPFPFGEVRILSVDALIVAKMAMGRPKDLATVRQLEAIRERREGGIGGQTVFAAE